MIKIIIWQKKYINCNIYWSTFIYISGKFSSSLELLLWFLNWDFFSNSAVAGVQSWLLSKIFFLGHPLPEFDFFSWASHPGYKLPQFVSVGHWYRDTFWALWHQQETNFLSSYCYVWQLCWDQYMKCINLIADTKI